MSRTHLVTALLCTAACFSLFNCLEPPELEPSGGEVPIEVGESRWVECRFLRFEVSNYEQTLTRDDLLNLPQSVHDRLWLMDLELQGGANAPRIMDYALEAMQTADPESLTAAARNMQRLLSMTPDNADLEGTSLEQLIELAPLLGLAPAGILADLMGTNVEDSFLSPQVISETIVDLVIGTHPNAQTRLGPITPDNLEGVYPVTPGTLPITLQDALTDLATLSERYGPVFVDGVYHPGFVAGESRSAVLGEDFQITVRASANGLPYKGIDLTDASIVSVNSILGQFDTLFDFNNPDWMATEGLKPEPVIEVMTFRIVEHDAFVPGGRSPMPYPYGSSSAWQLPAWTLERVLIEASSRAFRSLNSQIAYFLPDRDDAIFTADVTDGWLEVAVEGGIGSPPPPAYLWDVLLEVAQARLHDLGLAEGEADVEFTLRDIPIGLDNASLERTIRENIEANPETFLEAAGYITDTTTGAADFYYYRADADNPAGLRGDWLYFVTPEDIPLGDDGLPVRPYSYARPGFFADAGLSVQISSRYPLDGDDEHEKIQVREGDVIFMADDTGAVFELAVGPKTSLNRLALVITRVR